MERPVLIILLCLMPDIFYARQPIVDILDDPCGYHGRHVTISGNARNGEIVSLGNWEFGLVFEVVDQGGNCVWAFSDEPPNEQTLQAMRKGMLIRVDGTFYRVRTIGGKPHDNIVVAGTRGIRCEREGKQWKLVFDLLKRE